MIYPIIESAAVNASPGPVIDDIIYVVISESQSRAARTMISWYYYSSDITERTLSHIYHNHWHVIDETCDIIVTVASLAISFISELLNPKKKFKLNPETIKYFSNYRKRVGLSLCCHGHRHGDQQFKLVTVAAE